MEKHRILKGITIFALLVALLSVVSLAQAQSGQGVFSWRITDTSNPASTCDAIDNDYADPGTTWLEVKLEGAQLANGTYLDGTVTISNFDSSTNSFDWQTTFGVDAVVVKDGQDGASVYVYDGLTSPADDTTGTTGGTFRDPEETNDTFLTTPNNGAKGISNIKFCFDEEATAITLDSFEVEASNGTATINWETATEIDNAGFNLYRATSPDGPWVKINAGLIEAQDGALTGASYTFVDTPGRGAYYYRLEDLDYYGVSTLHESVLADLGPTIRRPWFRPILSWFGGF